MAAETEIKKGCKTTEWISAVCGKLLGAAVIVYAVFFEQSDEMRKSGLLCGTVLFTGGSAMYMHVRGAVKTAAVSGAVGRAPSRGVESCQPDLGCVPRAAVTEPEPVAPRPREFPGDPFSDGGAILDVSDPFYAASGGADYPPLSPPPDPATHTPSPAVVPPADPQGTAGWRDPIFTTSMVGGPEPVAFPKVN